MNYTATFLVGAHRFEVSFPKLQTFSEIFWALHIDYSQYEKTILAILFICLFTKLQQQKYIFIFRNNAIKLQHVLFENEPFLRKMLTSFFSSNIPLCNGKNLVEKLSKVLKMELKTYTLAGLKFVFEKIRFKVLHYIQHGFIPQRPGLSKDQISMFRFLVINYFILTQISSHVMVI